MGRRRRRAVPTVSPAGPAGCPPRPHSRPRTPPSPTAHPHRPVPQHPRPRHPTPRPRRRRCPCPAITALFPLLPHRPDRHSPVSSPPPQTLRAPLPWATPAAEGSCGGSPRCLSRLGTEVGDESPHPQRLWPPSAAAAGRWPARGRWQGEEQLFSCLGAKPGAALVPEPLGRTAVGTHSLGGSCWRGVVRKEKEETSDGL